MSIAAPIQRRIAENIIQARSARGWSQAKLGEQAGTSRTTIAQIETTEGEPRITTLAAIANALEVPLYLLVMTPDDAEAMAGLLNPALFHDLEGLLAKDSKEVQQLKSLLDSRILRDQRKASKMAYNMGATAGYDTAGAMTGSAIGAALMAGSAILAGPMGVVAGAALASSFVARKKLEDQKKRK